MNTTSTPVDEGTTHSLPAGIPSPMGVAPGELTWWPEKGMGYYPVQPEDWPYDADYWAKYEAMAATQMGRDILMHRLRLAERWARVGAFVDVGIGSGTFVEGRGHPPTRGYDVNPVAVAWLKERDIFLDPWENEVDHASFWDVLEHIMAAPLLLQNVRKTVLMTVPIFTGPEHVLRSHHFRRDEHYWYWTRDGLIAWMEALGFTCVHHCTTETLLGREDIHSFVFKRER